MRLHILQHVPFETPAYILEWAEKNKFPISTTRLYEAAAFPNLGDFDALIIMGGPMGVYDEGEHPWLYAEKRFVEKAIVTEKKILGICLGAQLLAAVLGAKVRKNWEKEIGWFPVKLTVEGQRYKLFQDIPASFTAFHWHGDTFDIPEHGIAIAESMLCTNQGFVMNSHIIGLQFHLESTAESIENLITNCGDELLDTAGIQNVGEIRKGTAQYVAESNKIMAAILDRWSRE